MNIARQLITVTFNSQYLYNVPQNFKRFALTDVLSTNNRALQGTTWIYVHSLFWGFIQQVERKCCPNMIFTVSPKQLTYNGKRILVLSVIIETYHPPHFPLNTEVRVGTSDLEGQVSTSQHTTHLCQGQTVLYVTWTVLDMCAQPSAISEQWTPTNV